MTPFTALKNFSPFYFTSPFILFYFFTYLFNPTLHFTLLFITTTNFPSLFILFYIMYYILLYFILYILLKSTRNIHFRFENKLLVVVIVMGKMWPRIEARSNPLCQHFQMPAQPNMKSHCHCSETERRLYYVPHLESVLILPHYTTKYQMFRSKRSVLRFFGYPVVDKFACFLWSIL
jgi:hypothetical protein